MSDFVLVAASSLAGLRGFSPLQGPAGPSPAEATDRAAACRRSAMVVTRTGGFAGVNDVVSIAADGTAQVTSRSGETRSCTPDLAALGDCGRSTSRRWGLGRRKAPVADGFNYAGSRRPAAPRPATATPWAFSRRVRRRGGRRGQLVPGKSVGSRSAAPAAGVRPRSRCRAGRIVAQAQLRGLDASLGDAPA